MGGSTHGGLGVNRTPDLEEKGREHNHDLCAFGNFWYAGWSKARASLKLASNYFRGEIW
jgi:hypothetical protein